MSRPRRLQLVQASRPGGKPRTVFRKRRAKPRSRQVLEALLLVAAGIGLLVLLLQLPELIDLDSLLLVSSAIGNLISGLSRLLWGVLQLLAVLLLVALALLALVLLGWGMTRLVRALLAPAAPARSKAAKASKSPRV
jgi:hypothetical protein